MLLLISTAFLFSVLTQAAPFPKACVTKGASLSNMTFTSQLWFSGGTWPSGGDNKKPYGSPGITSMTISTSIVEAQSPNPTSKLVVDNAQTGSSSQPATNSPVVTSSPVTTSGSSNTKGSSGSAVGLAWSTGSGDNMQAFADVSGSKLQWYYNWATSQASNPVTSLEFVPQIWGSGNVGNFDESSWPSSSTHILSFNEPDQLTANGGSNLSPSEAATLHQEWVASLTGSYQIGSPAVARGSKAWLEEWITDCAGKCQYDFVAFHFYGTDAGDLISYATDFYTTFNKPLWLTEWSCMDFTSGDICNEAESQTFMQTTISWFETNGTYVERWAWFGAFESDASQGYALEDASGNPNALGKLYVTL